MICLLIYLIAASFSLVNANDNFISHNDTFENTRRKLDGNGNKNGNPSANDKSKQATDSNGGKSTPSSTNDQSKGNDSKN